MTFTPQALNCPNCGGALEKFHPRSKTLCCPFCTAYIEVRRGEATLQEVVKQPNLRLVLNIGQEGTIDGETVRVVGHIRYGTGRYTWDEFLIRHAATLVQCDFLNKRIWTAKGLRDVFVLVFLHVGTRRAFVTSTTTNPTEAWVREQTASYLQHAKSEKLKVKMLFHDRDSKFSKALDDDLEKAKVEVRKTAFRSPNTNAYVERFIQTIQQECLDHFVVLGQRHFDYLHFNPVKHGHVARVADWPWSSFHRAVRDGVYAPDWAGVGDEIGRWGE